MAFLRSAPSCVIGVGASAGGVEALTTLFPAVPPGMDAAFLVVLHIPASSPSQLDSVLARATPLRVAVARDGERIRAGHVYVGTPDRHLMLQDEHLRLTRGPKECRVRPAIDVLFRSLAVARGRRAAGVVLSGMLDDGTAGLWSIKEHGGAAFVQDPAEAMHASMPRSAAEHVATDAVAPVAALAPALAAWCANAAGGEEQPTNAGLERHAVENRIAAEANALQHGVMRLGRQSQYTCPDCHGVLVEISDGKVIRYRCHTGHAFSMQTLLAEVDTAIDNGLWDTIRAMEERLLLLREMAKRANAAHPGKGRRFEALAHELEAPIESLRRMVLDHNLFGHEGDG